MYKTLYLLTPLLVSTSLFAENFYINNDLFSHFYVIEKKAIVYEKPDIKSKIVKTLTKGESFKYSKEHFSPKTNANFIPYSKYTNKILKGWVKRSNLIADSDFKKVKVNWPFKKIEYEIGDYFIYMHFPRNAKGFTHSNAGDNLPTNVYQFKDLIKIQYLIEKKQIKNQEPYEMALILISSQNNKINLVNSSGAYLKYETHNNKVKIAR